jgi:hypothetical protein
MLLSLTAMHTSVPSIGNAEGTGFFDCVVALEQHVNFSGLHLPNPARFISSFKRPETDIGGSTPPQSPVLYQPSMKPQWSMVAR